MMSDCDCRRQYSARSSKCLSLTGLPVDLCFIAASGRDGRAGIQRKHTPKRKGLEIPIFIIFLDLALPVCCLSAISVPFCTHNSQPATVFTVLESCLRERSRCCHNYGTGIKIQFRFQFISLPALHELSTTV